MKFHKMFDIDNKFYSSTPFFNFFACKYFQNFNKEVMTVRSFLNSNISSDRELLSSFNKGRTQKTFKKKLKYTDVDFVQNCPRIPKIYPACLSDVSRNGNYFLKLTRPRQRSFEI